MSSLSSRSPLKPVEFLVLAVLAEEPLHGYGIVQQIEERTGGRVVLRPGDVYRVIYRLEERGLLRKAEHPSGDDGDERRTYYDITADGSELVRDEAEMLAAVSAGVVSRVGESGGGR
ncbi:MAG: PadR family transcriptional regulator [Acidobacteriota bacterium]|jgi:DNA-binding PadR family transcriptional regulator